MISQLSARDHRHLWHPCSQMKDYELFQPLAVVGAKDSYIELADGRKIIDAIASWWCKSLGHGHPGLQQALREQIDRFEHVIFANTTHEAIVSLSEKLAGLTTSLNKVFYASEGSSAVEIALKMSLHARKILGEHERTRFIALENGYHGETIGAMSVSDVGLYRAPYESVLFDSVILSPLPYVNGCEDPIWQDCEAAWSVIEKQLTSLADTTTAVIVEPIVQGAGGMKIYSADFLKRLRVWTQKNNIHLIADEIMTGIGRTGKMLACEHAQIEPDFLCLAKGLTAGWLPLSAVLTRATIYDLFYDDYASGKSFLHSHTHSGNALAVSVANAVLNIVQQENFCDRAQSLGKMMREQMQAVAEKTQRLKNIRGVGALVAADLMVTDASRRVGYEVFQQAVTLGALLRPIGNTIYWLPPLTLSDQTLEELTHITAQAILAVTF
jgi:adenosylmethionine-8-amino-7-oxononanoate aminotransferase